MLTMTNLTGFAAGGDTSVSVLALNTTATTDTVARTTYTFSTNNNIGTASATRRVFAIIYGFDNSSGATLSSATIGGISATLDQNQSGSGGAGFTTIIAIASATVTTGTTVTVTATFSTTMSNAGCLILAVDNLQSVSPLSVNSTTLQDTSISTTVNKYKDGITIGAAWEASSTGTLSWTGLTKLGDINMGAASDQGSGAYELPTADATSASVSFTSNQGLQHRGIVVASYR